MGRIIESRQWPFCQSTLIQWNYFFRGFGKAFSEMASCSQWAALNAVNHQHCRTYFNKCEGLSLTAFLYEFYLLAQLSSLPCEKPCCATAPCYLSLGKTCLEGTPADICTTQSLNLFWEEVRQAYCLSPPSLFCLEETRGQIHNLLHHHTSMSSRRYLGNASSVINISYHRKNQLCNCSF